MVSEDTDQVLPGLLAIHRLSDFCDIRQTHMSSMDAGINQLNTAGELLKIPLLR